MRFFPCNVYDPSQFSSVREGENQALKCKVICVNHHHLLQRELCAAIPGGHILPG